MQYFTPAYLESLLNNIRCQKLVFKNYTRNFGFWKTRFIIVQFDNCNNWKISTDNSSWTQEDDCWDWYLDQCWKLSFINSMYTRMSRNYRTAWWPHWRSLSINENGKGKMSANFENCQHSRKWSHKILFSTWQTHDWNQEWRPKILIIDRFII